MAQIQRHTVASADSTQNDGVGVCFMSFLIDISLSAISTDIDQVSIAIVCDIEPLPSLSNPYP